MISRKWLQGAPITLSKICTVLNIFHPFYNVRKTVKIMKSTWMCWNGWDESSIGVKAAAESELSRTQSEFVRGEIDHKSLSCTCNRSVYSVWLFELCLLDKHNYHELHSWSHSSVCLFPDSIHLICSSVMFETRNTRGFMLINYN